MSPEALMSMQIQAAAQATPLHILAVDDDPVMRELIADYLGQNEFRVTAVPDGPAMQAVLAENVVDLVVLDLKLQGEDGMALARRLRDESAIPIIMLTGRKDEADRVMGLELGATGTARAEESEGLRDWASRQDQGPGSSLEVNVPSSARKAPSQIRKAPPQTEIIRGYDPAHDEYDDDGDDGDGALSGATPAQ
jgi:CheY-like chemotaxis protein